MCGWSQALAASSVALEQFCLLAKSARDRAAAELIKQALSNKKVFVVGELLAMPNMQALAGTEYANYFNLLELFAYGTFSDYVQGRDKFPELTEYQTMKLRQLSIVSLAHRQKQVPYDVLRTELGINNVRELEDLIIDTMYSGLITGKMDQAHAVLKIKSAIPRDVRMADEVRPSFLCVATPNPPCPFRPHDDEI